MRRGALFWAFEVCLEGTGGIRKGGNCNSPVVKEQKPKQEFWWLEISNGVDTTQFKVSRSDQVDYMNSHCQVHVKPFILSVSLFHSLFVFLCAVQRACAR